MKNSGQQRDGTAILLDHPAFTTARWAEPDWG